MARSWLLLLTTAVANTLTAGVVLGAAPASAATYPLDPARNLDLPHRAYGWACTHRPARSRCENIFIRALNRGRAKLAAPAYPLPTKFHSLTGADQVLVLANLDRKLYGRTRIVGLNPTLNASAERGAATTADPAFVQVGGQSLTHGSSNWAGGMRSPLFAYFLWMYADAGLGWEHRHNVLMRTDGDTPIMGVGSARDASGTPSWTTLIESFPSGTPLECVPTVLLLSARSGADPLRIFGLGFLHVQQVTFGGVSAAFDRLSVGTLRAVPPPHAPGRVRVQIVTRGGASRLTAAALFRY